MKRGPVPESRDLANHEVDTLSSLAAWAGWYAHITSVSSSALRYFADSSRTSRHVRLVPRGDICSAANRSLFDHLVGAAEQREREGEAECLGGFHVDDQLDLGGLLDRQLGGLFALENPANIDAG
jgi:hypothetical protein